MMASWKKYNTIWDKVNHDIKKIDREPVYNKNILKTKIKPYGDKATDFYNKQISKAGRLDYTSLTVINVNPAIEKDKKYYPQVFLKDFKYVEKEKLNRHISEDKKHFSNDADEKQIKTRYCNIIFLRQPF